jgi:hypothetical protein
LEVLLPEIVPRVSVGSPKLAEFCSDNVFPFSDSLCVDCINSNPLPVKSEVSAA